MNLSATEYSVIRLLRSAFLKSLTYSFPLIPKQLTVPGHKLKLCFYQAAQFSSLKIRTVIVKFPVAIFVDCSNKNTPLVPVFRYPSKLGEGLCNQKHVWKLSRGHFIKFQHLQMLKLRPSLRPHWLVSLFAELQLLLRLLTVRPWTCNVNVMGPVLFNCWSVVWLKVPTFCSGDWAANRHSLIATVSLKPQCRKYF